MIEHPPITSRRPISGELVAIHDQLMDLIVRLDLLGEFGASSRVVEAVEALVDAPPLSDLSEQEHRVIEQAHHAYHRAIDAARNTASPNPLPMDD